jgi:hypothetical protein
MPADTGNVSRFCKRTGQFALAAIPDAFARLGPTVDGDVFEAGAIENRLQNKNQILIQHTT